MRRVRLREQAGRPLLREVRCRSDRQRARGAGQCITRGHRDTATRIPAGRYPVAGSGRPRSGYRGRRRTRLSDANGCIRHRLWRTAVGARAEAHRPVGRPRVAAVVAALDRGLVPEHRAGAARERPSAATAPAPVASRGVCARPAGDGGGDDAANADRRSARRRPPKLHRPRRSAKRAAGRRCARLADRDRASATARRNASEQQRVAARTQGARQAEREAKVKAAISSASRCRAPEERAGSRGTLRRADEQRARPAPLPRQRHWPLPWLRRRAPANSQEICAGRNVISQAICESRECASAGTAVRRSAGRSRAARNVVASSRANNRRRQTRYDGAAISADAARGSMTACDGGRR